MTDSSTSFTSQSNSKKTKPFHFRAKFENQDIQVVANLRNLHQHTIKLSIKNLQRKQSYNTQEKMAARNQTKDLKCATHLLSDKFRNMSEEKKAIVRDLGFGGLMHIPPLRVHHQLLRELANNFKLGENRLETGYGSFKITPRKIGHALGINATGNLFPQKMDYKKLSEDDKGITDYEEKKKKEIDGCLFALMIIYFHLSKNKGKKRAERPPKPWIANWSKEQLVERMSAETEEILYVLNNDCLPSKMDSRKRKKSQEESDSDSESESESSDESEESSPVEKEKKKKKTKTTPKKTQPKKKKVVVEHSSPEEDQYFDGERYEISSEDLDELLRENVEKYAAEGENEADLRSTEGRYVSSEIIPAVNLGSDDPSSQGRTEHSSVNQPAESIPVQQSASEPADSNIMVVREKTLSDALAIVPIQVFVPASQTTTVLELQETPETDFEPTPLLQIEGTTETTLEPSQKLEESTPTLPPAPSKSYPTPEDAAALLMMTRTASYVPKTDPMPSFSLGFTDSSQEETTTQEGPSTQEADREKTPETAILLEQLEDLVQKIASSAAKEESKSPQIQKKTGGESSGKFETPAGIYQITDDMKEKCYIWATRVKTYADDSTNKFDNLCTLIFQDNYILNRMLQAESYIESESMAVSKHPNGAFISPKTNKEFSVKDYPSFIPFIDAKKLTSHRYIFAPVCYSGHWWLWVIDTKKWRYYILDPLHKKAPTEERKQGYVISRMRAYAGGEPLKKKENELEIKPTYVKISGQKSSYDCAIYVMKWLELIEPENIKREKYKWDNWPQEEVDHYRVEYASRILFNELNKERDQAIRASNAIRLSKPSSILLSPFCQINSTDVETE
ncbi:hypothetical protein Ahy_B03g063214 [Arachis hypogaea]|uniref:Ubiquitin-like protease family profile domain-containing protein n=1 Tax=Arachis hypogaea TaxID=3818 RepID=A0A444ZWN8_ARAHY|nr:hypothetical protein Ahy_B03g063214 [Arachis hypogaea]